MNPLSLKGGIKLRIHITQEPVITVPSLTITGSDILSKQMDTTMEPQDNLKVYLNNANDYGTVGGSSKIQESLYCLIMSSTVDSPATVNVSFTTIPTRLVFYTYPVKYPMVLRKSLCKSRTGFGACFERSNGDYGTDNEGNYVVDMVRISIIRCFSHERVEATLAMKWCAPWPEKQTDETAIILEDTTIRFLSNGYTGNSGL